jgi:hypothetical protein
MALGLIGSLLPALLGGADPTEVNEAIPAAKPSDVAALPSGPEALPLAIPQFFLPQVGTVDGDTGGLDTSQTLEFANLLDNQATQLTFTYTTGNRMVFLRDTLLAMTFNLKLLSQQPTEPQAPFNCTDTSCIASPFWWAAIFDSMIIRINNNVVQQVDPQMLKNYFLAQAHLNPRNYLSNSWKHRTVERVKTFENLVTPITWLQPCNAAATLNPERNVHLQIPIPLDLFSGDRPLHTNTLIGITFTFATQKSVIIAGRPQVGGMRPGTYDNTRYTLHCSRLYTASFVSAAILFRPVAYNPLIVRSMALPRAANGLPEEFHYTDFNVKRVNTTLVADATNPYGSRVVEFDIYNNGTFASQFMLVPWVQLTFKVNQLEYSWNYPLAGMAVMEYILINSNHYYDYARISTVNQQNYSTPSEAFNCYLNQLELRRYHGREEGLSNRKHFSGRDDFHELITLFQQQTPQMSDVVGAGESGLRNAEIAFGGTAPFRLLQGDPIVYSLRAVGDPSIVQTPVGGTLRVGVRILNNFLTTNYYQLSPTYTEDMAFQLGATMNLDFVFPIYKKVIYGNDVTTQVMNVYEVVQASNK